MRVAGSENEVENSRRHLTLTSGLHMQAHVTCVHTPSTYTSHTKRIQGKLIVTAFSFKFGKSLNVKKMNSYVYKTYYFAALEKDVALANAKVLK